LPLGAFETAFCIEDALFASNNLHSILITPQYKARGYHTRLA